MKNVLVTIASVILSIVSVNGQTYKIQDVPKYHLDSLSSDEWNFQNYEYTNVSLIIKKNKTIIKSEEGVFEFKNDKDLMKMGFRFNPKNSFSTWLVLDEKTNTPYHITVIMDDSKFYANMYSKTEDGITMFTLNN